MSEPRCGLIHMRTGCALAKLGRGDCEAAVSAFALTEQTRRRLRHSAYEFKLQVAKAGSDGQPELLWIRIGAHPQRCLSAYQGDCLRFERWLSPAATEPQWRMHVLEAQERDEQENGETYPALCLLQNVCTGTFLCLRDGRPCLSPEGDLWGVTPLRSAATPGKLLRRSTIAGGLGIAAASVGAVGVVGATAVGATARCATAVSATGAAVSTASTAVGTAATAVSGLTLAKAAAAIAAIPSAVASVVAAGSAATAAVTAVGATVHYTLVGVGCGAAVGTAGAVCAATARLVSSARRSELYVHGYPFLPAQLNRSASKLSTLSRQSTAVGPASVTSVRKRSTSGLEQEQELELELTQSEADLSAQSEDDE